MNSLPRACFSLVPIYLLLCGCGYFRECKEGETATPWTCYGPVEEDAQTQQPAPTALYSQCICGNERQPIQSARAFFSTRPAQYNTGYNKRLRLASSRCENLAVCPVVGPNNEQVVVTGRVDIEVSEWTYYDNYYGSDYYSVEGRVLPQVAETFQLETPKLLMASLALPAEVLAATVSGADVKVSSDPLDCRKECGSGSPLCEAGITPTEYSGALSWMVTRIQDTKTGVIEQKDILETFRQADATCKRSDTYLVEGKFLNAGQECIIASRIPKLDVDVRIAVPPVLSGRIERQADLLRVVLDSSSLPNLIIDDAKLQNSFGGFLRSVEAEPNRISFETENGCIQIVGASKQ